ncbi:DMT family transporter [Pseudonocardia humida]|uniref:EamA family transporter n=1 Tax=Pseudonocardia humida TaxID=2800819 RepID=A0ABT1A2F2_9PSEU|nr:EamA family transporter [Pseudonocardia humida]MCO1657189.1 EamA family transporter [Pseudonocardia humida]
MDPGGRALSTVVYSDGDRRTADRTWLVAVAAALWGTDGLLRLPLAGQLPAATIVFWEHLLIVLVLIPFLPSAVRAFRGAAPRERLALLVIGVGSSAVATALFTQAFTYGDPVTPLVLQKLQPVVAVVAAAALLGERFRPGYWAFAVPALIGAWLVAFKDPLSVAPTALVAALLAIGAAVLWAIGTVLGRMVSVRMPSRDVTVLRFAIGLPAAAVVLALNGAPLAVTPAQLGPLALLALVPGLLGLSLYYLGLRATAAARATLAELAFPVTAALIGVTLLGASLTVTQWVGLVVVVAAVTGLGLRERSRQPLVVAPVPTAPAR